MAGLSAERLAEVKDRLLDRKKRLWLEVKDQLKSSIGDGYQEMLSTARDEEDQATVSLMAETSLTLLGPKRQELEAIEEALLRLENGNYGVCDNCGLPIQPKPWRLCRRPRCAATAPPNGRNWPRPPRAEPITK